MSAHVSIAFALSIVLVFAAPAAAGTVVGKKLVPPATGKIRVAVVVHEGATMIDFAGPWEVFQDVHLPSRGSSMGEQHPFALYTVSISKSPIRTTGGMTVIPDYTFADAPAPHVVVIGAQSGDTPQLRAWLEQAARRADVVMSVCTGSFKLGAAGLLDGKPATTHHDHFEEFSRRFPRAKLVRDRRFVQSDPVIMTTAGLSSGIDGALHVVERYFGREVAQRTADYMEYSGAGWKR